MTLPNDVREALLNRAKMWILSNYVGGQRKLEAWSDHYASLTAIQSFSLPGNRAKNLRRLAKLAQQGLLIERPNRRKGEVRSFTLPRPELDQLGEQAVREWEQVGYVVGEMMDEIVPNPPEDTDIDLERLANDIDYWNSLAPSDEATHFCTEAMGFEFLTAGDTCDIPKPGSEKDNAEIENLRSAVRRLKAFVITHHGASAKVLKEVNKILNPEEVSNA